MNATSQARLAQVHPVLQRIIPQLCAAFDAKFTPWHLEITQGVRTASEQHALFLQGRASLAAVNQFRAGQNWAPITEEENNRVTDADANESWHVLGCAVDVAPELTGIDWDGKDEHWEFIVEEGENLGLRSGIGWRDEPHFQVKSFPISPTTEILAMNAAGGMAAVWASVPDSSTQDA